MHVFLSPHLDDVILSCGATIARLKERGETVIILTVMAGEPPEMLPDTPIVQTLRDKFEGVHKAVMMQRMEHAQAAMCLGVQVYHLSIMACSFRTARSVEGVMALYPSAESEHGDIHPADDARVSLLATPLPFQGAISCIYAPLGVGNHVDHQLVRDWGLVLGGAKTAPTLKFYAEYPSVLQPGALDGAVDYFTRNLPMLRLGVEVFSLGENDVQMKLSALRCYGSQVNMAWETMDAMEQTVREWMVSAGNGIPAERYWNVLKQTGMLNNPWT